MTKQYDNTNTGAAFQKDGFEGFSGTLNVDGKEYWISVYDNETKEGKSYRKLKVKPKEAASNGEQRRADHNKSQAKSFSDDLD